MDEQKVNAIVQKSKDVLAQYYGVRLHGVILYGSMARRDGDAASDYEVGNLSLYRNAKREGVVV